MAKDSSSGASGRLGELLVREKLITPLQLQGAVEQQRKSGGRLGHHLTKLGYVQENELTAFLSQQYGVPSINLSDLMKNGAEKFDGIGGGHDSAAGAKITKDKLDEFLKYLDVNVVNVSSTSNSE